MILLTSAYLPPIQYFTKLYSGLPIVEERADHYVKQTYRNRCIIAADDGPLPLTVPVETEAAGTSHTPMRDIRISNHGNWRHQHWNALMSSYGQSPFYEYYADDLAPFYEKKWDFLVDFNEALMQLMCQLVGIPPRISRTESFGGDPFAQQFHPVKEPYWQVFGHKQGFRPNLSIVDLLFNMGPEGLLLL